jgi:integrase
VRITAHSAEALAVLAGWWTRLREDVRLGLCTEERADELIAERRARSSMTLVDIVRAFAAQLPPGESTRQFRAALRSRYEPWFEAALLRRVDRGTMARFVEKMREKGFADSVLLHDVKRLRRAVRWALDARKISASDARRFLEYKPKGQLSTQPAHRPKASTLPELLPLVEAAGRADLEAAARGVAAPDLMDRVLFLAFTMLRKSEATALRWSDVEANGEILRVYRQGGAETTARKSGGAPYKHRMHPFAVAALERQRVRLAARDAASGADPIWPRPQGGFRTGGDVIREGTVERLAVTAGMADADRWTTHCLRHTGASMEAYYARDLGGVQWRGGWRSATMAAHYAEGALPASAIPRGAPLEFEEHETHAVRFLERVNELADAIRVAVEARRSASSPRRLEQKRASAIGIQQRLRAMTTWAELARDAIGERDEGRIPFEHAREAKARITRVAHAAFVKARREGLPLEDCRRVRKTAEKKIRDEWTRAIGMARKRLTATTNQRSDDHGREAEQATEGADRRRGTAARRGQRRTDGDAGGDDPERSHVAGDAGGEG